MGLVGSDAVTPQVADGCSKDHSLTFGFGLAAALTSLVVGKSDQLQVAAYAALFTALVSEITCWLWCTVNPPPRKRRADLGSAQARRHAQRTQKVPPPLYAARVSDLGPTEYVRVRCECGRAEVLTAKMLLMIGAAPKQNVSDLGRRMRCRACEERGRAIVSD
jgi:hypothetical protein